MPPGLTFRQKWNSSLVSKTQSPSGTSWLDECIILVSNHYLPHKELKMTLKAGARDCITDRVAKSADAPVIGERDSLNRSRSTLVGVALYLLACTAAALNPGLSHSAGGE